MPVATTARPTVWVLSTLPIAEYALLSDCHSAALVSTRGSVDWCCFPRFDSASVFGRILDAAAGHWAMSPVEHAEVTRRYVPGTMVLETTFRSATGTAVVVDALAVGHNARGHELGAEAPAALLRRIAGVRGTMTFDIEYAPRPEYGLIWPLLEPVEHGLLARGGASVMALSSPLDFSISTDDLVGRAQVTVDAGGRAGFALHHRTMSEARPPFWSQEEIDERIDGTMQAWRTWSELHQSYDGPWRELVHQSGRVLYALHYYPTGAICAAPTTSLPETEGGTRNWDYRYAWVRDASFTLQALWVAACPDEADRFFEYLAQAAASQVRSGCDLQVVFGIGGERDLSERELPHLAGWRGSAPVRVGNGAWSQRQIDVYGELLDAVHRLPDQLDALGPTTRHFFADLADAAATRWTEKDQGIWEIRGEPQHFVYSKLMCWVALDRAIALAERLDAADRVVRWKAVREQIAEAILAQGWSDTAGAFTQAFGSDALDASNLMMVISGFLPATDLRMRATIDAIAERLTDDHGLVYRYRAADGLPGEEGTFLLCTFWLAEALALAGQVGRATETMERAIAFANDVGLLSEEVDAERGELLGNFPQAFSHIGLVNAAWAIARAQEAESGRA
ncbi:MAG: glycoside hydrolase family 15 protein [Acidimicrobiia bacterium]